MKTVLRYAFACGMGVLILAYTFGVVLGIIPETQRIDAVHLLTIIVAILVIAVLLCPHLLARVKSFEVRGVKLEMKQVKERQEEQQHQLNELRVLLPLLLPQTERTHLYNLDIRQTFNYRGSDSLRSEVRRLRSIGLISMKAKKSVNEMHDDHYFNLADFAELTPLGKEWVKRLRELEHAEATCKQESKTAVSSG